MSTLEERARISWRTRWEWQASAASTRARVQRLVEIMGAEQDLAELETGHVEELVSVLERDGLASSTVNRYLAVLSAIVKDARADGEVVGDHRLLYRKEPEGRLRWFTAEEVLALSVEVGALNPYWGYLVLFLADTGLRPSEALRLKWGALNLVDGRAHVWQSKTGKARTVPLTSLAVKAVERIRAEGPVKLGPWYGDSIRSIQRAFAKAKWRVPSLNGDKSATLYCLRHTAATRLAEAGVHIRTIQEWLGHSSIRTTQRYAHVADSLLESARDSLEARNAKQGAKQWKA